MLDGSKARKAGSGRRDVLIALLGTACLPLGVATVWWTKSTLHEPSALIARGTDEGRTVWVRAFVNQVPTKIKCQVKGRFITSLEDVRVATCEMPAGVKEDDVVMITPEIVEEPEAPPPIQLNRNAFPEFVH